MKKKNETGIENKLHLNTICDSVGNYMYLKAFPTQVAALRRDKDPLHCLGFVHRLCVQCGSNKSKHLHLSGLKCEKEKKQWKDDQIGSI